MAHIHTGDKIWAWEYKFYKNRKGERIRIECDHPVMGYGGIKKNTDCELTNCP